MENIAKNPGLLDIAEKIFLQLNYEDLMAFIFSHKYLRNGRWKDHETDSSLRNWSNKQ